jgi:hypothetical protein
MEIASIAVVETEHRTYWPMARAANADLLVVSMPRVNLLLTGPDHLTRAALKRLIPCLRGPIELWSPGAPLILPAAVECGTLILRDVDALSTFEQYRLLKWLELPNLRSRVISTTSAQLRPRADAGSFDASLYFRLNVACVDLMA